MADKAYTAFKSRLTRLVNKKDHQGVVDLWAEFQRYYWDRSMPLPDLYRRWESAAEDAAFELRRGTSSW